MGTRVALYLAQNCIDRAFEIRNKIVNENITA